MTNNNPSAAREFAFKFFYHLFLKENSELLQNFIATPTSDALTSEISEFQESYMIPDKEHPESSLPLNELSIAEVLIKGTLGNYSEIADKVNAKLSKGRVLERLEEMDRAILLVGTHEILHTNSKFQHVINDFIELSKKYSSENSPGFVNGILDAIAKSK